MIYYEIRKNNVLIPSFSYISLRIFETLLTKIEKSTSQILIIFNMVI